jgi:hypothetical protein
MIPTKLGHPVAVFIAGQWKRRIVVDCGKIGFRAKGDGEAAGLTVYYYADEGKTWRRISGGAA